MIHNKEMLKLSKKESINTFKLFLKELKNNKVLIFLIIFFSILSSVTLLFGPILIRDFLSEENISKMIISKDGIIMVQWNIFIRKLSVCIFVFIISSIFNYISAYSSAKLGAIYTRNIRQKINLKLDRLSLSYFDGIYYGDVLSIVTNDVSTIGRSIQNILGSFFSQTAIFIGTIIAMYIIDWRLASITLLSLPIYLFVVLIIYRISGKYFKKYRKELGNLNGNVEEYYSGFSIIKLFNQEKLVENNFNELNKNIKIIDHKAQFLSNSIWVNIFFISRLLSVAITVFAGIISDIPTMVVFFIFLVYFSSPIESLSFLTNTFQSVIACNFRIYKLLNSDEEKYIEPKFNKDNYEIYGDFEFKNVYFQYEKNKPLIKDFNLKVNKGDSIAIVGPTGSGKTTLVNLIMRFYDINSPYNISDVINKEIDIINEMFNITNMNLLSLDDTYTNNDKSLEINVDLAIQHIDNVYHKLIQNISDEVTIKKIDKIYNTRYNYLNNGCITLDNKDIREIDINYLRSSIGMVLQDTWIFKGTIKENLLFGNQNASEEDIIEACKKSYIHHYIETLPGGYDFMLKEGGENISQGQRQLLTIARAIIGNPKILILDEATSNVDTRTEELIQNALNNITQNKTNFIIAHRLSTIKKAKQIIVLNNGEIIEMGNHKELLDKKGFYADLYNCQFLGKQSEE
ncbi:MAG: ABC transporter transmembrane domain-containing protein [Bacillales bacterium]